MPRGRLAIGSYNYHAARCALAKGDLERAWALLDLAGSIAVEIGYALARFLTTLAKGHLFRFEWFV